MADYPNVLDFNNLGLMHTGQTTNYTPAGYTCVDDGGEGRGEPHYYTVFSTGQYSGTTDIILNAKTETKSNNCVLCNINGLMFSRTASGSVGPASDGLLYWDDSAVNNEDIFAYCDAANTASYAGHTDWRIPNCVEIHSLLHRQGTAPYVHTTSFPVFPSSFMWSSSTRPDNTAIGIVMSTAVAAVSSSGKTAVTWPTILVRGDKV